MSFKEIIENAKSTVRDHFNDPEHITITKISFIPSRIEPTLTGPATIPSYVIYEGIVVRDGKRTEFSIRKE